MDSVVRRQRAIERRDEGAGMQQDHESKHRQRISVGDGQGARAPVGKEDRRQRRFEGHLQRVLRFHVALARFGEVE